jgi:hypothetical protein
MICLVDYDSDSKFLIRLYSPNSNYRSDSDVEELVYQELVDRIDKGHRK